jgi:hypothetical protein
MDGPGAMGWDFSPMHEGFFPAYSFHYYFTISGPWLIKRLLLLLHQNKLLSEFELEENIVSSCMN